MPRYGWYEWVPATFVTALLESYELVIQVMDGGEVRISALS